MSVAQRTAAQRLQTSKQTIPHFYLQTSFNAAAIVARRQAAEPRQLAWDAFFVLAVAKAIGRFERFRCRLDGERLVPADSDAIGVAIDTEDGLFVIPVAAPGGKTVAEISDEIRRGAERLRSGDPEARRIHPALMTVTNLGMCNVESFVPIINPPEAAILGVGKVLPTPVVHGNGELGVQHRGTLTLSVDHRVASGKYAAEFLGAIVNGIGGDVDEHTAGITSTPIPAERLAAYGRDQLLALYERMVLIREFEDGVKFLFLEGTMPGTIHQCQGQEATAVGVCAALRAGRLHHLHVPRPRPCAGQGAVGAGTARRAVRRRRPAAAGARAAACTWATWPRGWSPGSPSSAEASRWRPAWRWPSRCSGPTGSWPVSSATGPWPKARSTKGVNMAAIWNLPVVFACENNLYGASTHVSKVMRDTNIARRVSSYGIRSAAGGRQRRAGGPRGGPGRGRRLPGRPRPGAPGTADLPPHRPLAPRSVPLPAQGRTRGVGGQRSDSCVWPTCSRGRASSTRPAWRRSRPASWTSSTQAVARARNAPLPTRRRSDHRVLV